MNIIERIRAEIERLYAEHSSKYGMDEAAIVLDKLEDFIDSLHEEPDKGLEEAAEKYRFFDFGTPDEIAQTAFKAGAEWQKEQMMKEDGE